MMLNPAERRDHIEAFGRIPALEYRNNFDAET